MPLSRSVGIGKGWAVASSLIALVVGGGTVPSPQLVLSSTTPSIAADAAPGTLVANISNVPAGATPAVTPTDGRLVVAGNATTGWKVVVGMTALSAGSINFSISATGATGASGTLTLRAATAPSAPGAFFTDPFFTNDMFARA